jgi:hypothetical protein
MILLTGHAAIQVCPFSQGKKEPHQRDFSCVNKYLKKFENVLHVKVEKEQDYDFF